MKHNCSNEQESISQDLKNRKKDDSYNIFIILICVVIIFWTIDIVILPFLWFRFIDLPVTILRGILQLFSILIIPIMSLYLIVSVWKKNITKIKKICSITAVLLLLGTQTTIFFVVDTDCYITLIRQTQIISKSQDDNNYSFNINFNNRNVTIRCDNTTFNNIIIENGIEYSFEYRWTALNPEKGIIVGSIDKNDMLNSAY